jgi:putative transposase
VTDEIERQVYRYIERVCADDKCNVLAIGGMPDHVHLLVMLPGTIGHAALLQHIKGGSSRFISEKLKPGEWFAWQGHYGAISACSSEKDKLIRYIMNQKQHHADGTLWPSVEKTQEDDV